MTVHARQLRVCLLVLTLLAAGLAGCLGSDGDEPLDTTETPEPTDSLRAFNASLPSGQSARDLIESYVMTHPFRISDPAYEAYMSAARDDLEAHLEEAGLATIRQEFDAGVNILGIQEGTTHPGQWIVLTAHYDTAGPEIEEASATGPLTTVYGAWDNGAGTAALMELADALGQGEFPFTVVYAFVDAEEKGLLGSKALVEHYINVPGMEIVANLNMDPPGLNWPCGDQTGPFPVKLIHETDKVESGDHPRFTWLFEAMEHGLAQAEVPDEVRDYTAGIPVAKAGDRGVRGGSDHLSFGAVNIPNAFLGGTPATIVGGDANDHVAAAMTYPLHTPLDTLQAMEARCQVGTLADGLHTTVTTVAHTLAYMAQTGVPQGG